MRPAVLSLFLCLALVSGAAAQLTPTPGATVVPLDGSQLYRIEEGLFQIQQNQTVDITDRSILFTIGYDKRRDQTLCMVNGNSNPCVTGARIGFQSGVVASGGGTYYTKGIKAKDFEDKEQCFIDVVSIKKVKGAPIIGTFRLSCF